MRYSSGHIAIATTVKLMLLIAVVTLLSCVGGGKNTPERDGKKMQITKPANYTPQCVELTSENMQDTELALRDTLSFGKMHSGEMVVKKLRIKNSSKTPTIILRHTTSCGCVKMDYERKPIMPDSVCDIGFTFDSRGERGWQLKLVEFYFAEMAQPLKLYIEAEVE